MDDGGVIKSYLASAAGHRRLCGRLSGNPSVSGRQWPPVTCADDAVVAQGRVWANLRDAETDLSAKPRRWSSLFLEYHHFDLDEATDAWYTTGLKPFRRDPTGQSGTTLGSELDFRMTATPWPHVALMAGFGRFFPGGFVKKTGPAAAANWYFAQTSYAW